MWFSFSHLHAGGMDNEIYTNVDSEARAVHPERGAGGGGGAVRTECVSTAKVLLLCSLEPAAGTSAADRTVTETQEEGMEESGAGSDLLSRQSVAC